MNKILEANVVSDKQFLDESRKVYRDIFSYIRSHRWDFRTGNWYIEYDISEVMSKYRNLFGHQFYLRFTYICSGDGSFGVDDRTKDLYLIFPYITKQEHDDFWEDYNQSFPSRENRIACGRKITDKFFAEMKLHPNHFIHEIIHFFDYSRLKGHRNDVLGKYHKASDEEFAKSYYNDNLELNAYYQQTMDALDNVPESEKATWKSSFDNLIKSVSKLNIIKWNKLTEKSKKKYKTRLYNFWVDYLADKNINETVKPVNKELADTKLITSTYEMNEYLKNHNESRFVYDTERDWYLVGDAENSIHIEMINDALLDGVYPAFEWNGHMLPNDNHYEAEGGKVLYNLHPSRFLLFRTSSDELNLIDDYVYDRYRNVYVYKDYCVFDRSGEFKKTPLYKLLGKPLSNDHIELDETVDYIDEVEVLIDPTYNEFRHYMKKNRWYRAIITKDSFAIWDSTDSPLLHSIVDAEYDLTNSTHIFVYNNIPYLFDYDLTDEDYAMSMKDDFISLCKDIDNNPVYKKYFPNYSMEKHMIDTYNNGGYYLEENKNNKICESFIQNKDGDFVYYTASGNTFLTIVKNKFKGIPVRAYYDYKKKLYVFGDGFKFIHTELLQDMIRYTNVYSTKSWDRINYNETGGYWPDGFLTWNVLDPYCAMFQILPDDNFKKYNRGDGYNTGWFTKIDDLIFCCRTHEYNKCRDKVPLFDGLFWTDVGYYEYKKEHNLLESSGFMVHKNVEIFKNPNRRTLKSLLKDCKELRALYVDGNIYVWDANKPLLHKELSIERFPFGDTLPFVIRDDGIHNFVSGDYEIAKERPLKQKLYAQQLDKIKEIKDLFPNSSAEQNLMKDFENINEGLNYNNINWQNNMKALGNVSSTIGHNLFAKMMAHTFLRLTPKFSYGDDAWFDKQIKDNKPFGMPFLKVEFDFDNKIMKVVGHEGRHRVAAITRLKDGNITDIPVAILYNHDKYPNIPSTQELRTWKFEAENSDIQCDMNWITFYNKEPLVEKEQLKESMRPKINAAFWKWFGNSKVVDKKGKPLVVYHGSGANNIQEFDPTRGFNVDAIYFSDKLSVASHWSGDYFVKKKIKIEETEDVNKLLKILNQFVKAKVVNYDGYYRLDIKYDDGDESSSPLGEKIDDRYYQKGDGTKTDLVKILQRDIESFSFKSENSGNYACYLSIQNPLEIYACRNPYWKIEFNGKEVNTETIAVYAKERGFDGVIIYDVYETDYENQLCNDYIVFDSRQIKSVDNGGRWDGSSKNIYEDVRPQYLYHAMWKKQFLNCKKEGKLYSHSAYESNGNNTQHRIIKGISMSRNLKVCIEFMENQIKEFQDEWKNVSPLARMHVNFSDNEDENYVDASSDLSYVVLVFDRNKLKQNHKIIPHSYLGGRMRDSFGDEQEEVVVGDIPNFMDYVVNVIEYNNNVNRKTLKSKDLVESKIWSDELEKYIDDPNEPKKKEFKGNPNELAKKEFGTTFDCRECGYILTDGSMLDFSEKRYGGTPGTRNLDHRNISKIDMDMDDFCNLGNIRCIPIYIPKQKDCHFMICKEPTQAQYRVMAVFTKIFETITVECMKNSHDWGNPNKTFYKEYKVYTTFSKIKKDIENYFKG